MAVIAVYSVKGGVGKTTIAANLAWCAASLAARETLLWDLDPAGGAAFLYGFEDPQKEKAARIFSGRLDPAKLIRHSGFKRLDVLPADESLRRLDGVFAELGKKRRLGKLAEALSARYERIILDCPPVLSETSAQAIRAADIVIVPLPPSPLSRRALETVRRHLEELSAKHPPILPVLSMYDGRRTLHKELRASMPDWPIIPMASAIEQVAARQQPVGAFAATSPGARAFARLWEGIERKLKQQAKKRTG